MDVRRLAFGSVVWMAIVPICAAAVLSCGSKSPTAPEGSTNTGGTTITGREQIAWTQPAASLAQASSYTYGVYVDGTRVLLQPPSCATSASGYDCSSPLPTLTAGRHVLEMFALDPNGVEGPRAPALVVTVSGS